MLKKYKSDISRVKPETIVANRNDEKWQFRGRERYSRAGSGLPSPGAFRLLGSQRSGQPDQHDHANPAGSDQQPVETAGRLNLYLEPGAFAGSALPAHVDGDQPRARGKHIVE